VGMQRARRPGVTVKVPRIDFAAIMNRMRKPRDSGEREVRNGINRLQELDSSKGEVQAC
jgi:hypothetical protein